jgi:hypothetical protein
MKGGAPAGAPSGASFSKKLENVQGAEKTAAAEATRSSATGAVSSPMTAHLEAISREIAAGKIHNREEAVQSLVDRVLDSKFGGKVPPATMAQMKSDVAAQIVSDPSLSERIDRLLSQASE